MCHSTWVACEDLEAQRLYISGLGKLEHSTRLGWTVEKSCAWSAPVSIYNNIGLNGTPSSC
jgi:hypothetical protein